MIKIFGRSFILTEKLKTFVILKFLKPFQCHYKLSDNLLSNPRGGSLAPGSRQTEQNGKHFQKKLQNLCKFYRKIAKILDISDRNHPIATRNL